MAKFLPQCLFTVVTQFADCDCTSWLFHQFKTTNYICRVKKINKINWKQNGKVHVYKSWICHLVAKIQNKVLSEQNVFLEISSENQPSWLYFLSFFRLCKVQLLCGLLAATMALGPCFCFGHLTPDFNNFAKFSIAFSAVKPADPRHRAAALVAVICGILRHNIIVNQRQTHSWAADAAAQHHCGPVRTMAGPDQE